MFIASRHEAARWIVLRNNQPFRRPFRRPRHRATESRSSVQSDLWPTPRTLCLAARGSFYEFWTVLSASQTGVQGDPRGLQCNESRQEMAVIKTPVHSNQSLFLLDRQETQWVNHRCGEGIGSTHCRRFQRRYMASLPRMLSDGSLGKNNSLI